MNITSMGHTRRITAIDLVEDAFRNIGCDPSLFDGDFLPYWIAQGKSLDEIIAISGETPKRAQRRTA